MTGFDDYTASKKIVDLIRRIARQEINKERPAPAYGTVTSVDAANRRVFVQFPGEDDSVGIAMSSPITPLIGQVVRVEGITGDRYVTDIIVSVGDDGEATPVEPVTNWKFWNDDIYDVTVNGTQTFKLTYKPDPQSLHVELRGIKARKTTQWTLDGQYLTLSSALDVRAGDVVLTEYAYDAGNPTVSDLLLNVPYGSNGWRYLNTNDAGIPSNWADPAFDDSSWRIGKGGLANSTAPSNLFTTPYSLYSGYPGSEKGWNTDVGPHQPTSPPPLGHDGNILLRRWVAPGVNIFVKWDIQPDYGGISINGVGYAGGSTGVHQVRGVGVPDQHAPWLLAVNVLEGNGWGFAAIDVEITGTEI